jgi:Dyp-type peroxidase family
MPIDLNTRGIETNLQGFEQMFKNLQGNILKGHGRDHTVHIFFELKAITTATRKKLIDLLTPLVTSAFQQHIETQEFKKFRIPGAMFANFLLTAKGYRALGFSDAQLKAFQEEPDNFGTLSNFREGMIAHGNELNDPAPNTWEAGYREGRIDGMILLADDDVGFLLRRARDLIREIAEFATILVVERGDALRDDSQEGIEHFGYVDGRSQPIYLKADLKDEGLTTAWDPLEPLKRVLVPDPFSKAADTFGSYLVFRKLEQDVLHFKMREAELADELGLAPEDRQRAGAMAVGRFKDGTPLALSQTDGLVPAKDNNFNYSNDLDGTKCPFHAHIRKTNPRGDIVRHLVPGGDEEALERSRRITRRGITYDQRNRNPKAVQAFEDLPMDKVGLLFMCFQASIPRQFAFMQKAWANQEDFVLTATGQDPVIGQPNKETNPKPQQWPVQWGPQPDPNNPGQVAPPPRKPFSFGDFVTLKGGEFFFAPSMPFLKVLAP